MHLAYFPAIQLSAETSTLERGRSPATMTARKNTRTTIGDSSFVGSNSTLSGSGRDWPGERTSALDPVITKAVPPDALALGRARQVMKENWASKRRNTSRA